MAFRTKEITDLIGILFLMLLTIPSIASTNLDCYGKAFHCVNSTHFMICVDLGRGVSTTIDDFIIPCPATTVCWPTNRFECEFPVPTVLPPEISTIATTQTSESEVVTSNPLVATSIPFEEYFNTVSTTTLSQSDLQSSSTDSVLPVDSINVENIINTSKPQTVNTNESISRDANVQLGSKVENNPKSSVKSSDISSSNVENNITSNLNIILYDRDATTPNNTQELTTIIDVEPRVTDSSVLNTLQNNSLNDTSIDIVSAINEQIAFTTESFPKDFRELLLNTSFSENFTVTPVIMTVKPIVEVKDNLNASKSENNLIVDRLISISNATTHYETASNTISGNDEHLKNANNFYFTNSSLEINQTIIPYEAVTVINEIHDKSDTHVTEQLTVTLSDIATTETTTTSDSNDTYYQKPPKSTTTPTVISEYYPSWPPDYGETNERSREFKEIINETKSETNAITVSITSQTEASKTTEAQINIISSNSGNPNVTNIINVERKTKPTVESVDSLINEFNTTEPTREVKKFVNATKTEINIITDSTTGPIDASITMEATINIVSNNSIYPNVYNKINEEVANKSMGEVKEIVNATKLVSNLIIIHSSNRKSNASISSETLVNNSSDNSVTQRNFNTSNTQELITIIDVGPLVIDSSVLNTLQNNSLHVTSTDIVSATNEQIAFTTESFSKDFREPLLNTSFTENFSIAPEFMVVKPVLEVKDIYASKSESNVMVDGPISLSNATTHNETTTNTISGNDEHLKDANNFYFTNSALEINQTIIPYEAVTVINEVNKEQFTIHGKLDTHLTEQFTVTLSDIATTETITTSESNDTYSLKLPKSTTTPAVISEYYPTSPPDYGETNERSRKVKEIINERKSDTNIIKDSITDQTEASKTTEAQINVITSNSRYPNDFNVINVKRTMEPTVHNITNKFNTTEPTREVRELVNAAETETNIMTDSTTDPTDASITMETTVNIVSNKSIGEVKETVKATKSVSNIIIINSSIAKSNASTTSETLVNISSNNSVTQRNVNNSNTDSNTNITSYDSTIATNLGNDQGLFKEAAKQPATKSTASSAGNNLGNDTTIGIDTATTTVASITERTLRTDFQRPEGVTNGEVNVVVITDPNAVKEIEFALNNNLETLTNSSSKVANELEFTRENIINDLQNDAENITYDLNHLLGNTTDRIVLHEKVYFINFEDNNEPTQTYQPDVNKTENTKIGTTLSQINESAKNEPRFLVTKETTTTEVAVADKKDSANMNKDSFSEKSSPAENVAKTESVTLHTAPSSSIVVNASERSIDMTHQINDNTRSKNDRIFAFTESLETVTTEIPSTTMHNRPTDKSPDVSLFKDYTDQVILPDQNQLIDTAAEIITLFPPTETVDLNHISSTKHKELSQNTAITMGTPTSFPTNIKTTEIPYKTPDYIATKKTAGFPGKPIIYNTYDDTSTTIDMPSQPTPSNVFFTTLDSSSVETKGKNSTNKSKTKVLLPDGNNDSNVANRFITHKQILSAAATTKKENINSRNLLQNIAESVGSFNDPSNHLTETNIIITTGTVYKHASDTFTVKAAELATLDNVSVDRVVEEVNGSTARSNDVTSENADTVKISQKPSIVSTHNNSTRKVEIQQSQSERPISITELNYDSVMISSTIPTKLLDNIKIDNASAPQHEITSSTNNFLETITRSMSKELHMEVYVGQGVNTYENNMYKLSTNLPSDVSAETFATPGFVLLDTTINQDLRPSFTNQNIATTERTLLRSIEPEVQVATEIPVISRIDSLALKENLPITQVNAPNNYLKLETNTLENNIVNKSSLVAKNEESVETTTSTDLNTRPVTSEAKNLSGTASFDTKISITKAQNTSSVDNKENIVPNQGLLDAKLYNESKNIHFSLNTESQSPMPREKLETAASTINDIPVTRLPKSIEAITRNNFHIEFNTQPEMSGDVNLGTTKFFNNGITLTESPHVSLIKNEANFVPYKQTPIVTLDINIAGNRFEAGYNTHLSNTGDKNIGTPTSSNNGIIIITASPDNVLINEASNYMTSNATTITHNKNLNLGTTNFGITQTESPHASLTENEANDVPHQQILHSDINNASHRFEAGSNTQSIISGDTYLETTTSYKKGILIIQTEYPDNLLVNEASKTPNPELPDVTSNAITTNIPNNKENVIVVTTISNNDIIEEPMGTIVVSTPSSSSPEHVTYRIQKTTTKSDNTLTSVNFNTESPFVTKPVENVKIELPQTNSFAAQTFEGSSNHSKYNNISNVAKSIEVPAIKLSVGTVQQPKGKSLPETFSVTPQDVEIANEAVRKPFGVAIDLDNSFKKINATADFDVANIAKSQTIRTVDSRTIINQLTYGTSTTPTIIGNKQESITSPATQSHQTPMKTSEYTVDDVTSAGLATKLIENDLERTTEHFPVFTQSMNTDVDVKVSGAVTPTARLRPKTEVNNIKTITGFVNISPDLTSPSVKHKQSVKNDGFRDNMELSASSDSFSVGSELSTGTDVLVDNMESEKTHSGISLITQPPIHREPKEKKEKSENNVKEMPENLVHANSEQKENLEKNGTQVKERSEILLLADEELILLSVKRPSTPSINLSPKFSKLNNSKESNNISIREELLIKTESNDFKSTTDIDGVGSTSMKINAGKLNENGTKISGSEPKTETPTHEVFEISAALPNDSYISNNKSKVQNKNTFDAHNTTVISTDQSSTPRYMSLAKSTAVGDKQTEFPAFESTTVKPNPNKFTCNYKKRGRYADELDCRKFYICLGTSQVVEGTCPNNTVFSEIRKQCTNNLSHCIRNKQFRCVTEGHFSDFLNDNVYYICVKNNVSSFIRFKLMCQNGYHLNKTSVQCVLNKISPESTSTSDSSKNNSDQSVALAKLEQKEKPMKMFKCKKEGIFADRSDCRRYFECTKTDTNVYRQKRKKCDSEEIFHRDKKTCVDDDSYECN